MVVDDKSELRQLLKSYLTQEGFDVVTANDGQEALYVARHEKPNLIILDLMMPEMGGYEFVRAFHREAETPVVILTAKIDENDKVLGLELGADDYVTKPFSPRELTACTGGASQGREASHCPGSLEERTDRARLDGTHNHCQWADGNAHPF